MNDRIGIHCFISGHVQGVWFRAETQKQAQRHDIRGHAENLADGRVEVVAFGTRDKIEKLLQWLNHGPALATVESLSHQEIPWQECDDFIIK